MQREYLKTYNVINRERLLEYHKKYRDEHREQRKLYTLRNKKRLARQSKEWWENNQDSKKEYAKRYQQSEKGRVYRQRSYFRSQNMEVGTINNLTYAEWLSILEDYNYRCAYCGKAFSPSNMPMRDHVIPISRGGNNTKENIKPACKSCNSKKGTMLMEEILFTLNNK